MQTTLFIAMALFAVAIPVSGEQTAGGPPPTAQPGPRRSQPASPYSRLFETQDLLKQAQAEAAKQPPKTTRVCGMTIIEADPFFDQKMKVTPPKDPNVRYTIRAVEPSICK